MPFSRRVSRASQLLIANATVCAVTFLKILQFQIQTVSSTMQSSENFSHVCEEKPAVDGSSSDGTWANLLHQQLLSQLLEVKDDLQKHQNGETKLLVSFSEFN